MAGDYEYEYQGWICNQAHGQTFPKAALELFVQAFPKTPLCLLYIRNQAPLEWLTQSKVLKHRYHLMPLQNPIYNELNAAQAVEDWAAHKKKSKGMCRKIRKMEEEGVFFKKIKTLSEFESLFDTLISMYEARLSSAYNTEACTKEPNKKPFWLELFKQGLVHVSTLNIGDKIISFHTHIQDGKTVYLTLLGHDAAYDQYSIGGIHIIYLIEQLSKEGYLSFELTPPAVGYKLRWSNAQVPVHTLTIYPSKLEGFSINTWLAFKDIVRPWIQPIRNKIRPR